MGAIHILIISPGKSHDRAVADAIAEYEMRLSKKFPVAWATPAADTKERESEAILRLVKESDKVVLLDERGKDIDTPQFSNMLGRHREEGTKRLVFIIGGAFGVADTVRECADMTIKLSSLVFPHMLVRLILIEQLYRASSILEGGKYHHA
ncbi:MAG TPA: 23S rRNA (pseudouridine(1915)-N(3))-methyltransferase RlmH [Candidatus Paceibacterota bacterium]|nr:23S rRNA (pseudouridine(1915)-N(3))-methyltransferase RlmH [Candidatus Paceibacterota bacterium]